MKKNQILKFIKAELRKETKIIKRKILGRAWAEQADFSVNVYSLIGHYNFNNISMHLREFTAQKKAVLSYAGSFNFSRNIERKLMVMMEKIIRLNFFKLSGYFTSGGTESNIYALWIARNWAVNIQNKIKNTKVEWIIPKSSHYSIYKGLDILGVYGRKEHKISIINYDKNFITDVNEIQNKITNIRKKHKLQPIIIVLTVITTEFGLIDPVEIVIEFIRKNNFKNIFIHIDACYSGMILPFLPQYSDIFSFKEISTISVDFHKFYGGPIGSGVILINEGLERFSKIDAPYLKDKSDFTLSGSRTGLNVIQTWSLLQLDLDSEFKKYRKRIFKSIDLTEYLYSNLLNIDGIYVWYKPFINYIIFSTKYENSNNFESLLNLLYNYSITFTILSNEPKTKYKKIFKIIINDYIDKKTIDNLISDLQHWFKDNPYEN